MTIETQKAVAVGIAAAMVAYPVAVSAVCTLAVTNMMGPRTYEASIYDKWFSLHQDICVMEAGDTVISQIALGIVAGVGGVASALTKWCFSNGYLAIEL